MPSITVENYLKTILHEHQRCNKRVAMGQLAVAMDIAPGTATAMVKTLAESNLADYVPHDGVLLTEQGNKLALQVIRRHRLVELFLVEVLGFDWAEVHDEAEELEHTISEKVLERIDSFLGRPDADPHGDPIPRSKGKLSKTSDTSLVDCKLGKANKVQRVLDQNPEFLQFARQNNLVPGQIVTVESINSSAESVTVSFGKSKKKITLGTSAAKKILVEPARGSEQSAVAKL